MFGLFKKKEMGPFQQAIQFPPDRYAEFVLSIFEYEHPATLAHVLVAYMNFVPMASVIEQMKSKNGTKLTVDEFILKSGEKRRTDDVGSRRQHWFEMASALYRLTTLTRARAISAEPIGKAWCLLAESAHLLKTLLPHNVVWKPKEKEWFDDILQDEDSECIKWTVNFASPDVAKNSDAVKELANKHGFSYLGSNSTLGPLI